MYFIVYVCVYMCMYCIVLLATEHVMHGSIGIVFV